MVHNGWVNKTLDSLQKDIRGLRPQLAHCNPREEEHLQDRLNRLIQIRRCYLRWVFKSYSS